MAKPCPADHVLILISYFLPKNAGHCHIKQIFTIVLQSSFLLHTESVDDEEISTSTVENSWDNGGGRQVTSGEMGEDSRLPIHWACCLTYLDDFSTRDSVRYKISCFLPVPALNKKPTTHNKCRPCTPPIKPDHTPHFSCSRWLRHIQRC